MATTSKIPSEIIEIFGRGVIEKDNFFRLPNQHFSRPVYEQIKKVIEAAGGKWKKKLGGFTFVVGGIDRLREAISSGETINVQQVTQFFPTPEALAATMACMMPLRDGGRYLEPSAGHGALAKALFCKAVNSKLSIECAMIEMDEANAQVISADDYFNRVPRCSAFIMQRDFLQFQIPARGYEFDGVIMNPPFNRGDDIKHILHAWEFLNVGGKLVALCANGPKQNAILKPWSESLGGTWEVLPAGTFKSSGARGTNIETVLLTANA